MREPHKFPKVLSGVMVIVAILFSSFGVMGYMAYGSDIQTVVIVNLPQDQKFVQVVQCLYSVAILLSAPLQVSVVTMILWNILFTFVMGVVQLFPAVRIMENALFVRSGKHNPQVHFFFLSSIVERSPPFTDHTLNPPTGQVAKEHLPRLHCRWVLVDLMGWSGKSRRFRVHHWFIRLVSGEKGLKIG